MAAPTCIAVSTRRRRWLPTPSARSSSASAAARWSSFWSAWSITTWWTSRNCSGWRSASRAARRRSEMEWILAYLAGVTARSLCLFALALAAIAILRVRTAAARHAIWTVVMAGMLLLAALAPLAPPVALRVLGSASMESMDVTAPAAPLADSRSSTHSKPSAPTWQWPAWDQVAVAVYLVVALMLLAR